jgi:phosphatidylinositol 4-kinase
MPKKNKMRDLSQSTILYNEQSHESPSENKNADDRFKNIIKKFSNNFENDRNLISRTIYEPKTKKKLENSVTMNINTVKKLLEDLPGKEEEMTEEKMKKLEEQIKKEEEIVIKKTTFNLELLRNVFGESFIKKEHKIKKNSLFGKFNSHKIFRCIIKTHEDLRQEQFATQLINEFYQIFQLEHTGLWLNTYEIISTGHDSGLVEMVNDSLSLDQLKHKLDHISLSDFFLHYFGYGDINSDRYKKAIKNYIASLAGYSLVCYFLQIKDRHNGNILLDNQGHLIHIDFGFLLSNSPGKGIKFETAPFKLSRDLLDVMGGLRSKSFEEFKELMRKGFTAVNKHRHNISILVEMMWCGHGKNLDCFEKGQEAINELKARLNPKDGLKKNEINNIVDDLINQSAENWRTKWYDIYQSHSNGIFY